MNTKQLRQKILDMAIKGKLVPQDPNDEPADKLLEKIREEKEQLIKDGKIKRNKNESEIFVGADKLHYEKFADGSVVCIEDEIPFEIPESWVWCRLKNIVSNRSNAFVDGPFGSDLKVEHYTENREVRLIQLNNIGDGFWKDEGKKYTTFKHAEELLRCKTIPEDIVIAKMMPAGRCMIVPNIEEQYIISSDCVKLSIYNDINKNYITNMINSPIIRKIIQEDTRGIGRSRTSLGKLKELLIPLPPLSEQQRISETVETLLELVDLINSDKTKLSDLIKQTKAKVLDLAIKGKLVPQDDNDEPADKLLEKIREEKEKLIKEGKLKRDKNETFIFKSSDDNSYYEQIDGEVVCIDDDLPFEIPDSWRWCKLRNIGQYKKGPFGSALTKAIFVPKSNNTIKVYEQKNAIQKDANLGSYYITNEYYENKMKSFTVHPGEIIVSCAGTIGETYILPKKIEKGIINQALMRISLTKNMNTDYFLNYFDFILKREAIENSQGTAIKNIPPFDILKEMFIAIPPFSEQYRIIEKIKSIFTQLDTIQEIFLQ